MQPELPTIEPDRRFLVHPLFYLQVVVLDAEVTAGANLVLEVVLPFRKIFQMRICRLVNLSFAMFRIDASHFGGRFDSCRATAVSMAMAGSIF